MTIKSLSDLHLITIPHLIEVSYIKANEAYEAAYDDFPEFDEVDAFAKMVLPFREDMIEYKRYAVNVFAYHLTHGRLMHLEGLPNVEFKYQNDDVEYDYKYRVPKQLLILEKMWNDFTQPDIIASLLAFEIDPVKFWFALLWIRHYVDDKVSDTSVPYKSLFKQIYKFCEVIDIENDMFDCAKNFYNWLSDSPTFELTLKTHENRITIDNPYVVQTIRNLLNDYLEKTCEELESKVFLHETTTQKKLELLDKYLTTQTKFNSLSFSYREKEKTINLKERIYLFNKYMQVYLKDKKGIPHKTIRDFILDSNDRSKVLIDKNWLISRLLCVIGFGEKKIYYDNEHKDYLKTTLHNNNLKKSEERHSYLYETFSIDE